MAADYPLSQRMKDAAQAAIGIGVFAIALVCMAAAFLYLVALVGWAWRLL